MPKPEFDVCREISTPVFSKFFQPHLEDKLDENQRTQFAKVYAGHRKRMYEGKEPLQWIQHLSVLDKVADDFGVETTIKMAFRYQDAKNKHPFLMNHLLNQCDKLTKISQGIAAAREAMIRQVMNVFDTTGNQIP